jgi:acyl-coenzyme A synthetase/AMP-(fatty) acid ligase
MEPSETGSLWSAIRRGADGQFLDGPAGRINLSSLRAGSTLDAGAGELRGSSVLLATKDQLAAALALCELDGIVRRLVLCPPAFSAESLRAVAGEAQIDVIITDHEPGFFSDPPPIPVVQCGRPVKPRLAERTASYITDWVLFTSGTTGSPKMAIHQFRGLTGAVKPGRNSDPTQIWATFYDIRRYGGLQIYLRAMIGHTSLILSNAQEPLTDHLDRLARGGATHISGTPSHWRRVLMSPAAGKIAPRYVRLSGEIADQSVLDGLRSLYPDSKIVHAYASTEAGVGFEVLDGLEGFPASFVGKPGAEVELRVRDGTLQIRSRRSALRYLPPTSSQIRQDDGYVDTGDLVELRGTRYHFVGRKDGVINVGGQKVHPEEVETVINRHPRVRMSLVSARKSPIIGSLVVADVVPNEELPLAARDGLSRAGLENEIRAICERHLERHKVPALIRFVNSLTMTNGGKLARQNA